MTTSLVVLDTPLSIPDEVSSSDSAVVRQWLRSKPSAHTRKAYRRDIAVFYAFLGKSLAQVSLTDVQDYADSLQVTYPEVATQSRMLASLKSLLTFAKDTGFIPFNVGKAQPLPLGKDKLAERIMSQAQVQHMLYEAKQQGNRRNYTLLLVLYGSGCRCEEVCNLQWCDVQATAAGGQITVLGKRRKTRSIAVHPTVWQALQALRPKEATPDTYVFASRQTSVRNGKPSQRLTESQVWRVISTIAKKAGIPGASPHWLRHAHATHAMEKNTPLKLIQETLGHADLRTPSRYQHVRPEASSGLCLDL